MRKFMFILFVVLTASCTRKLNNYISTHAAQEKYEDVLKDQSILVFPQVRENPIKWFDSIPENEISISKQRKLFSVEAQPGEFFVYQLGVWAINSEIENVQVIFSDLIKGGGNDSEIIPKSAMTCFNTGGIDYHGETFTKKINIQAGRIQSLWNGIDLTDVETGIYTGSVSVVTHKGEQVIPIRLKVSGEILVNHGYDEGERLSRLNWLNSTVGISEEITKGYKPIKVEENKITILGRTLVISDSGLPSSITSFFGESNQTLVDIGQPIINNPFRFIIEKEDGTLIQFQPGPLEFIEQTPSKVTWKVVNTSNVCDLQVTGKMEFDGFVDFKLKLETKSPIRIRDIRLETPIVKEKAKYMMGLGHEGGFRKSNYNWHWDVTKNQDMLWVGDVNGGLRLKWKAENYKRPLVNIYYKFSPLSLPPSWGNKGKGGVNVVEEKEEVILNAYSGERNINKGEILHFDFELLITPLKLLNREIKYCDRYYHGGGTNTSVKIDKAKKAGANIINIHHAEDIYPYINYPFLDENVEELTNLVKNAHKENLRMKFYYTTRELTKNIPEFWAFYSLDGGIIYPGPGNASRTEALHPNGPNEWLIKNLRERYIPAWYNEIKEGPFKGEIDLSVITTPDSRLNNFYVAGLEWMVKQMKIDGVYIDDSALDRFTLQRARKIIDGSRPAGRIDLHSWNHFNKWAGFANSLNLYLDLLPYIDLVWIGEGRDYDRAADHWLIEVSGIPFGVSGQMLQGGGNPWRGMVYGITNRAGWTKWPPKYLWNIFDEYQFDQRELIGYWDERCPVKTNNKNLVTSVFKGSDSYVIAIGNWSQESQIGTIQYDWCKLGMEPVNAKISVPAINDFQEPFLFNLYDQLTIEGGKGMLLILEK